MFRKGRHHHSNRPRAAAPLFAAVDEVGIVVFFGALTAGNLDAFTDALRGAPRPLLVDLALVHRLDAAGVDALVDAHDRECDAMGAGIDVTAVSLAVARALDERGLAHHPVAGPLAAADDRATDARHNAG